MTEQAIALMNRYGTEGTPFLFIIDFEMQFPIVLRLDELAGYPLLCAVQDDNLQYFSSVTTTGNTTNPLLEKYANGEEAYIKAFDFVMQNLQAGNSFLTNLTAETPIELNLSLRSLWEIAEAPYKLWYNDEFICFSPETFVQINPEGKISSFPMKGTIDACLPDAEKVILEDRKEYYEHTTIVDLIRNDLSKICHKVWVEKFRYIDRVRREDGSELLQVSSKISGWLPAGWKQQIGSLLTELLPAGSISGAPKASTLRIISAAEQYTYPVSKGRGYYTGVFGIFDGEKLSSAVMIRFIQQTQAGLVYKSGGGITSRSQPLSEYQEMIQKIYAPVLRNN